MNDNVSSKYDKFFRHRSSELWGKFVCLRALVVETNDPLNMRRIRFRCPEMHESTLQPEHCPWAVVSPDFGGKKAGSWNNPCIGDLVWVSFEKGHPIAPVVIGFADPSRRKMYPLPSVYSPTPLPVDSEGKPSELLDDYLREYLPRDGRPMSVGVQDRYGNLDMMSSVGFFPVEHKSQPPQPDYDAIQSAEYNQSSKPPVVNDPDVKFMLRLSKYGTLMLMSDCGYKWDNEFSGDVDKDENFEIDRWKYMLRVACEDDPKKDSRQLLNLTRYGSREEFRDVGWAQAGPISSKSRAGEYGDSVELSTESERDERWYKMRTKGGWVVQACDVGFHPQNDLFIKRNILDELGTKSEREDLHWKDKDSRWYRIVGRHGYKFVIDERGSDNIDAEGKESPRGNGILMKGRRSPGSQGRQVEGNPIGFYWEFNENDSINQTTWGSPLGSVIQMNDKIQYVMATCGRKNYGRPWKKLQENEFLLEPVVSEGQETSSYHLKLDHHNEYLRLKTRGGLGSSPDGSLVNPSGVTTGVQQGLEVRDGINGDGPWVELVDAGQRSFWMWNKEGLTICHARRSPDPIDIAWWFNEGKKELIIKNSEETGRIQIYCNSDIEIYGNKSVNIYGGVVNVNSSERIVMSAKGASFELGPNGASFNCTVQANLFEGRVCGVMPGDGGGCQRNPIISPVAIPIEAPTPRLTPNDRGARYNTNLESASDVSEVEHQIDKST